jgi:hypothetical protein
MEGAIMRSSSRAGKSLAFVQELKVVNPESRMSDYDPHIPGRAGLHVRIHSPAVFWHFERLTGQVCSSARMARVVLIGDEARVHLSLRKPKKHSKSSSLDSRSVR